MDRFDYIIVGAGSAGCVLANRLSADPHTRVLLVEAGGRDDWIWFHIPVGYLFAIGNPRADWMFRTAGQPGLGGRSLAYPRGKVLGGSSAINAMIYMRGQAADYDGWRHLGLTGWGWDDVLPFFLKHEDHVAPDEMHRGGGEWRVEHPRMRWPILDAINAALHAAGIDNVDDFNRGDNFGSGYFQVNQRLGRRWSAARGFLKPAMNRPNLEVVTGVTVDRVLLSGRRAVGVAYREGGVERQAAASGEVILSAGAIGSPLLLEASGVGRADHLASIGVAPVHDLPGVGENLQDHLQLRMIFGVSGIRTLNDDYRRLWRRGWMGLQYLLARRGPLTMAPSQLGAFAKSRPEIERADLQYHFQPLSLDKFGDPLHAYSAFTASVCNLRPTSRGSIHATAARDVFVGPRIDPNYLATEADRLVAAEAIRLTRRVVAGAPLAAYSPREMKPGPDLVSDADLVRAAGDVGTTIFHPVGTAKMGVDSDPGAVLDGRLRVRGIERLRVVDASAMPTITSGNTNSPTLMIAEKASAMIREDAR